ncbi:MAG TPA: SDR family oxidoreductase [Patescibacteria group bacterium]|nr:SDR family oxidoreductase [Gammaproteobacteria bacterium]HWA51474.1 SDR family oxidoreductase [Patescibacteria group bacterium]
MSKPVTLITGTRKGIGKFLAHYYVQKGHQVIGCSKKQPEWELNNYQHFLADVSNEIDIQKMFQVVKKEYGRLDYLLNNAGIAAMNHSLLTPMSSVRNILNTNILGTFLLCCEATRLMARNKFGRIVNFTSIATPLKISGEAIYAASKASVNSLTQILAYELADIGITINAVGANPIYTDMIRNVPKEKLDAVLQRQAIKRFAEFEDITNVVDFFLLESSSFITGQIIYLGGIS